MSPIPTAAYNGYLMPVQAMWDGEPDAYKAVWPAGALGALKFEGKLYGLPLYAGIYGEIDRIEPVEARGEAVRPRLERYHWPLALALACGMLAAAWSLRRPGP